MIGPAVGQAMVRIVGDDSHAVSTLRHFNSEVARSKQQHQRDFGEIAAIAQRAALVTAGALIGVGFIVRDVNQEYDLFLASNRKLEAASKLTGTSLQFLRDTAEATADAFQLTDPIANELTASVSKLTAKAGEIGRTREAIAAFINLGGGQGLTVEQTLEAVRQSILGIDEGTDKLFQQNPSVLYKEYADSIGTTAGKLTDQQKAMAIVVAAMDAGTRVGDAYGKFLEEAAGQQQLLNKELVEGKIALAEALQPARVQVIRDMTDALKELTEHIRNNQDEIGEFADNIVTIAMFAAKFAAVGAEKTASKLAQDAEDFNIIAGIAAQTAQGVELVANAARGRSNFAASPSQFEGGLHSERAIDAARFQIGVGDGGTGGSKLTEEERKALDEHIKAMQRELELRDPLKIDVEFRTPEQDRQMAISLVDKALESSTARLRLRHGDGPSAMRELAGRDQRRSGAFVDRFEEAQSAGIGEMEQDLARAAQLVERASGTFVHSMIEAAGSADSVADALGNMLRSIAAAGAGELISMGLEGVVGAATAGKAGKLKAAETLADLLGKGTDPAAAATQAASAGTAATAAAAAGGPPGWAMLAAGVGISIVGQLLGSRNERKQDHYESTLRALKEDRQHTNITLVLPPGILDPTNPQWLAHLTSSLGEAVGTRQGRFEVVGAH